MGLLLVSISVGEYRERKGKSEPSSNMGGKLVILPKIVTIWGERKTGKTKLA